MNCPVCDDKLREVERYGVKVDICPSCKGVWLDRGELEKVASMEERGDLGRDDDRRERRHDDRDDDRRGPLFDRDDDDYPSGGGRRRRRSFLGDLIDF